MIRIIVYNCYHSVYSFQTKQYSNICVLHWIVAHSKLIVYFLNTIINYKKRALPFIVMDALHSYQRIAVYLHLH